jgi:Ca2+-binding RTX toxin-like protein
MPAPRRLPLIAVVCLVAGLACAAQAQAAGTYVALGDSVAAGAGANPGQGFVERLFEFLETPAGGGLDALANRARGGDDSGTLRTGGQLAQAIADIDGASDTRVVTILIGGNDRYVCSQRWHLPSCPFAANFAATLDDLNAALARDPGSEALVAGTYYNPESGGGSSLESYYDRGLLGTDLRIDCSQSGDRRGLNDLIACIGQSRQALVADVYPAFKSGGAAALIADGLHPNPVGHRVMAQEFCRTLPAVDHAACEGWPPAAATSGDDHLIGTDGNDVLHGLAGDDLLEGLAGHDTLFGDEGSDTVLGGPGDDSLVGGLGDDGLLGGPGRDGLSGDAGSDRLRGESGRDQLSGGTGRDRLSGGDGSDLLNGDPGRDRVSGGRGTDTVYGGPGPDRLTGGPGRDAFFGQAGGDSIHARDGRRDRVRCGRGRDSVRADRFDRLRGCERVRRARARSPAGTR